MSNNPVVLFELDNDQRANLAKNLKLLREHKGLTLMELVRVFDWSYASVWGYENNGRISFERLTKLSKYWNVPIEELLSPDMSKKYICQNCIYRGKE